MKTPRAILIALALAALALTPRLHSDGIPEPGYILFGEIRNHAGGGNILMIGGTLTWRVQVAGNGPVITVSTPVLNINNQFSYRVRIPYEVVVGGNTLGPNSFALLGGVQGHSRAPVYSSTSGSVTTNAVILGPATGTYNFGASTRGAVERVDLYIDVPGLGSGASVAPASIVSLKVKAQETVQPMFAFLSMAPMEQNGVWLEWMGTVTNRTYVLLRASELTGSTNDFKLVATFPPLTSGTNSFWDTTANATNSYFYRLVAP